MRVRQALFERPTTLDRSPKLPLKAPMLTLKIAMLTLALAIPATIPISDEGQGTAQPDANVDGLQMGTYLMGAPLDYVGKVLVVEIGGG
jgi:hypothetical protein